MSWIFIFIFITLFFLPNISFDKNSFLEKRKQMVQRQIISRGIYDSVVLKAMTKVPRHLFVPKPYQQYAYEDRPLPIGNGQTISQPYMVALMTELIKVNSKSKVLEVGTGSGYQAAVLAEIVDQVYTIEIYEELGKSAKERFKKLNYSNIKTKIADGYYGWKDKAPFDAILVTFAVEVVPPPLTKQLKKGGIMCIPVGKPSQVQTLYLIKKDKNGKITTYYITKVMFVPLIRKKN